MIVSLPAMPSTFANFVALNVVTAAAVSLP
jgi:hypothetical protein